MYKASTAERGPRNGFGIPPLLAPNLSWIGPGAQQGADAVAGFGRIATEWLSFVHRRLGEDVRLAEQLASARSPTEFWGRYAGFLQKAGQDYWDEYAALARLSGEIVHAGVEATRQGGEPPPEPAAAPVAEAA